MLQTAEGALSETHSILQRMRELSVQAANDTLTQQDRAYIQLEIDQLREEVTRIGNTTQFNKKKLLDGSAAVLWSSDKLSTKAIVNGGLRAIDQFGQKTALEGNFVIDVNATPGKAQVQKTDVFTIKHADVLMGLSTNEQAGVNGVSVNNIPAGDYTVTLEKLKTDYGFNFDATESATARYLADNLLLDFRNIGTTIAATDDASVEVTAITSTQVTLEVTIGSSRGNLVFNISDGKLDRTGSSTAIGTLLTAGVDVGDTKFANPIDTTKLRAGGAPFTDLSEGSTLQFDLAAGGALSWGPGTVTVGNYGTMTVTNPSAAGGAGTLLTLMEKLNATSFDLKAEAANASGTNVTWTLTVGGKDFTATQATLADGAITFAADTHGDLGYASDITFTVGGSTASGVNAGDVWTKTGITRTSTVGRVSLDETLTVDDYKSKIVFKTSDTTATSGHNITLRVDSISGSNVLFDILVDGEAATSNGTTSISPLSFSSTDGTTPIWIDGKAVNFTYGLGSGLNALDVTKIRVGDEIQYNSAMEATQTGRYGTNAKVYVDTAAATVNASMLMEVTGVSDVNKSVDFKITANILDINGSTTTRVANLTLYNDDLKLNDTPDDALNLLGLDLTLNLNQLVGDKQKMSNFYKAGDKLVYNITPQGNENTTALTAFQVVGKQNAEWAANWIDGKGDDAKDDVTIEDTTLIYGLNAGSVDGQEIHLKNFYVNEKDGTVYTGDIVLSLAKDFHTKINNADKGDVLASFEAAYVGQVAKGDVKLRDLDKFWNSEGRFLLDDAQKLTITQGDGKAASVTLYATDTLNDVATKLNAAIAAQLGQQSSLSIADGTKDPAAQKFVTFVNEDKAKEGTSEALAGTFVIRSIIAGANGEISFAGDEDLIKQLSLNELQAAEENSFSVSVWDAHTGKSVASSVKITGNKLIGVINENVDVVFDAMANIKVEWNEASRAFTLSKEDNSFQTILHLADNTTVFQIGANEGEDMGVNIGDMRAEALGLNSVLVTDRESAARAITVIDNAIDKVSTQRAKLGAYQNRLEHTITNLTVAGENLTAAESRIRDTDMAKEMMQFTTLQIMLQAGTSMLAQANTLPQNVLSLLR
jgi:flagellin-like hook-associated protein FlgL